MWLRLGGLVIWVSLAWASLAWGQDTPLVIHPGYGGPPAEATFQLIPKAPGARTGQIWVSHLPAGLVIQGNVKGTKPQWPANRSELPQKDHIEVWLSASPHVNLPKIGWGNEFGNFELDDAAGCHQPEVPKAEQCEAWYREQVQYRALFERLFTRQWLLASDAYGNFPGHVSEVYAQAAFEDINNEFFQNIYSPVGLAPVGKDGVDVIVTPVKDEAGYQFRIDIPYAAFPPNPTLTLSDLWLMVDVFSDQKTFSTTAPQRKWGDVNSFNHVTVEQPLQLELTPCHEALEKKDGPGGEPQYVYPLPAIEYADDPDEHPANKPVEIEQVVALSNMAEGDQHGPGEASPTPTVKKKFFERASNGAFACGPELTFVKGAVSTATRYMVSEEGFDTKVLADGWTLVKTGPEAENEYRSGECGACPRARLDVYAFSPTGEKTAALQVYDVIGIDLVDANFDVSPDWRRIVYYRQAYDTKTMKDGAWRETTYCLSGHVYQTCGEKANVPPPKLPPLKGLP